MNEDVDKIGNCYFEGYYLMMEIVFLGILPNDALSEVSNGRQIANFL